MDVENKIALVTGSGSGIGKGIAKKLAEEGALVVINDINKEKAIATVEEFKNEGYRATYEIADITNATEVDAMIENILIETNRIDILVNNTGIVKDNLILKMPEDDFDAVLNVNLKGAWVVSKKVLNTMKQKENGRIINISSRAWLGQAGQSNYSAAKGGLVSLTRSLAIEFAKYGITVNCIAPGLIDTPLIQGLEKKVQDKLIAAQPTPMIGKPEDVANAVFFLSTDESRYITGQILHVDGGKSLGARNI